MPEPVRRADRGARARQRGFRAELEAALHPDELATLHGWCRLFDVPVEAWHHVPQFSIWADVAHARTVAALLRDGETLERARFVAALRLGLSADALAKRDERRRARAILGRAADKLSDVPAARRR